MRAQDDNSRRRNSRVRVYFIEGMICIWELSSFSNWEISALASTSDSKAFLRASVCTRNYHLTFLNQVPDVNPFANSVAEKFEERFCESNPSIQIGRAHV